MTLPSFLPIWNVGDDGARLYVGGDFTTLVGVSQPYLGLLSTKPTGGLAILSTRFAPVVDNRLRCLAVDEVRGRVWLGGDFTLVNGASQPWLAVLDWNTGAVVVTPTPINGRPYKITLDQSGGHAYVGGAFTTVGGVSCNHVARFDIVTGAWDNTWNPGANGDVRGIRVLGSSVYVAGTFNTIGGNGRKGFAIVSTGGGVDPSFNPNVFVGTFAGSGRDILPIDSTHIVIAGDFDYVNGSSSGGGIARPVVALVNANGTDQGWDPMAANPLAADVAILKPLALGTLPATAALSQPVFLGNAEDNAIGFTHPLLSLALAPAPAGAMTWTTPGDAEVDAIAPDDVGSRVYTGQAIAGHAVDVWDQATGANQTDWLAVSDGFAQALAFSSSGFPG